MCQIRCIKYHSEGFESHYLVYSRKCFASLTISRNFMLKWNVRWGHTLSLRSSLIVCRRNFSPCTAISKGNRKFYSTKNKVCSLLDKDFLMSLGFLVDFLTQVNFLNQSLQGKQQEFVSCTKKEQGFRDKCRLLKSHLHQLNFFHFPQMKALIDSKKIEVDDIPIILFSSVFDKVLQEFSHRFQDFERISDTTRLVAYPHLVETETAPLNFQMELVELKNDE